MRILHLGTLYPPHVVGGAERSVSFLAEEQARAGHAVMAACLSPDGWAREERHGVAVRRMPHENLFWMEEWPRHGQRTRDWAKFRQQGNTAIERHFGAVIDEFAPDIVNTHSLVDVSTLVWRAAARRGVPIVHTLRDFDLLCAASSMYRETGPCAARHLKCRILTFAKGIDQRRVAAVTAVGAGVLETHLAHGFFGHVPPSLRRVIWNIADVPGAPGTPVRPPRDGPLTFGFLGRISPEKGIDVLLRAARHLPPTGWRLIVAGTAPGDMAETKALAYGLPVDFRGFVDPAMLLGAVDVLVVPSLWAEPLGRSVLEAYRFGVPVIGSDAGGIAEIIADPDWLFPPGDEIMLARLMARAIAGRRDALPRDGRFARVTARTRARAVTQAFDAIYEDVLAGTA